MNPPESNANPTAATSSQVDPRQSLYDALYGAWWTIQETKTYLGCSRTTVMKWLSEGIGEIQLPRIYIGREVRINPKDLSEFIAATSAVSGRRRPACVRVATEALATVPEAGDVSA